MARSGAQIHDATTSTKWIHQQFVIFKKIGLCDDEHTFNHNLTLMFSLSFTIPNIMVYNASLIMMILDLMATMLMTFITGNIVLNGSYFFCPYFILYLTFCAGIDFYVAETCSILCSKFKLCFALLYKMFVIHFKLYKS